MTASGNGTTPTNRDVRGFLDAVADERRRADAVRLTTLMTEVTGQPPVLWGTSIVGFGSRHYRYASGREGDTVAVGFAPRAGGSTLYVTGYLESYDDLLSRLGRHRAGKGCISFQRLDDVDGEVLREVVARSFAAAAVL